MSLLSPKSPFLALPLEIRNEIYDYALDWPDLSGSSEHTQSGKRLHKKGITKAPASWLVPIPAQQMTTPSILLVNRQLTVEALAVLHNKPLVISKPPPYPPQLRAAVDITAFISETALQQVPRIVLQMDLRYIPDQPADHARAWLKTVETLWCIRNPLGRFEVRGGYVSPCKDFGWSFAEAAHHRSVMSLVSRVRKFLHDETGGLLNYQ
jgi:hypothetical protein